MWRANRPVMCLNACSGAAEDPAPTHGASARRDENAPGQPPNPPGVEAPQLSPRMLNCLAWASQGKSSTDIGQLLGISPRTVDDYFTECRRRLGVRTRVQAIVRAIALGLIRNPSS